VDAVFAANGAYAIGFMAGPRKTGLSRARAASAQPVAVIGLGDLEMGQLISPRMCTISVHENTASAALRPRAHAVGPESATIASVCSIST
jgi:DNA-binding LacI/PurR family transcriptional regulator